ncbi:MAG: S41 family peptidase [Actinomadura sp.]
MRLQSGGMLTGRVLRGALVAASLICAYSIGAGTGGGAAKRSESAVSADRSVLDQAADQIATAAAKPVPRAELESAAIKAMLRSLDDPWARHYTAVEYDDVEGRLNGRYSGVGLWLATPDGAAGDDAVRVASVQPGSAAERAGVRVGDAIVDVDGRPATGWDVTRVATALRGRPATGVRLTVRRQDGAHRVQERSFQLLRAAAPDRSVRVERPAEGIELIRVAAFTRGVAGEVRDAVTRRAARLDGGINGGGGILLDLRGNPGGLLTEAVDTASTFLASGPVVTYERRDRAAERMDVTRPGDVRTPLVVLVDSGTASAAEIVAGSLRDRDRAVIVGSRTFGKGSVQEPIRLADGSTIELTVGRYRTPAGRSLDGVGIDPDVAVPADRPPQEAERRALTVLNGLLATLPTNESPMRGRG